MAENMATLHEICIKFANKQPEMADSLTEDAPILKACRWRAATHGLWNVAEKLSEVEGPAFVEADAPLPTMRASTDLVHTDLHVMGGQMDVPTQRALKFGGADKYFARYQGKILRKAGMDAEKQIVVQNWYRAAKSAKNLKDAGGKAQGWFILAVRFDEIDNIGLYDPDQFEQGRLFKITAPHGGYEHELRGEYEGVLGYSVVYRSNFGWQILDAKRVCAAIVNIDEDSAPTPAMIDDTLAEVRAQPGNTYLFCGPKAKIYGINPHKVQNVQIMNDTVNANTRIETWNGIPVVVSHNFRDKWAHVTV